MPPLSDVVHAGDRRASLEALRDTLATAIDNCDSLRDLAALSARLTDVLIQIESMPATAEVSPADEIAERRASRRTGSKSPTRPAAGQR